MEPNRLVLFPKEVNAADFSIVERADRQEGDRVTYYDMLHVRSGTPLVFQTPVLTVRRVTQLDGNVNIYLESPSNTDNDLNKLLDQIEAKMIRYFSRDQEEHHRRFRLLPFRKPNRDRSGSTIKMILCSASNTEDLVTFDRSMTPIDSRILLENGEDKRISAVVSLANFWETSPEFGMWFGGSLKVMQIVVLDDGSKKSRSMFTFPRNDVTSTPKMCDANEE